MSWLDGQCSGEGYRGVDILLTSDWPGAVDKFTVAPVRPSSQLLPEARVGGHGYSSLSVFCLSVTHESAHLAATALRLQHG